MRSDLRYAIRTLRRSPTVTSAAILVLALGIGANTAMFSVLDAVLLRPLPYPGPEKLVSLWMRFTGIGIPKDQNWVSAPEFMDLRQNAKAFAEIAAIAPGSFNIRVGDKPERILGANVSASLFPLLGVQPVLGRAFLAAEEIPGRDTVAVISHGLWRRVFASNPAIAGQAVNINGQSCRIVGVAPKGFAYPDKAELWMPLAFPPVALSASRRGAHGLLVIARIRDGISFAAARADMDRVSQRIIEGAPNYPYRRFDFRVIMNPLLEDVVGDIRPALLILMGAVACVLLIACSNVANLLLAKASGREREMAVRTALGAGRGRILGQLLTESVLLSAVGAVAGLLLAKWALLAITRVAGDVFPRLNQSGLNLPVLGFTVLAAMLTAVLFGLWPALQISADSHYEALKEGARSGTSAGRQRFRSALVVGEVALSLVLLTGAGLLIRSFLRLQAVDPGFRPDNVLTMGIALPQARYGDDARIRGFYNEVVRRVSAIPGVDAAGLASALPLSG